MVETGNADAGIVYETDARVSDNVKIAAKAPKGSHKPVLYPAAVIKSSKNADMAKNFINFLYSSKAKPTFEKYGFKFLIN
jgi:molybdate transport system substrate-binding protein